MIKIQKITHKVEIEDLDLALKENFENEETDIIYDDEFEYLEEIPVNIGILINELTALKDKGCNYVQIRYHCADHLGYELFGSKIYPATEDEVKKHIQKEQELVNERLLNDLDWHTKRIEEINKKLRHE